MPQIDIVRSRKISSYFKMPRWHWLRSQLKNPVLWVSFHFCFKIILGRLCKRQSVQGFWEQRSLVGSESTVSLWSTIWECRDTCYRPDGNRLSYKGVTANTIVQLKMKVAWSNSQPHKSFTSTDCKDDLYARKRELLKVFMWTLKPTNTRYLNIRTLQSEE